LFVLIFIPPLIAALSPDDMSFHQEFQPVILAGGYGSRLGVLVEESSVPKALLPVANRPLLSYQLDLLEKAGFLCTYPYPWYYLAQHAPLEGRSKSLVLVPAFVSSHFSNFLA
jgi:hypothetical protein